MSRYNYEDVRAELINQFQNESFEWYDQAALEVIKECKKDGDLVCNVINRLYRNRK